MEGEGYNKSNFATESGSLSRAVLRIHHDHTYAARSVKKEGELVS